MISTRVVADVDSTVLSMDSAMKSVRVFTRANVAEAVFHGLEVARLAAPVGKTGTYHESFRAEFTRTTTRFSGEFGTDDRRGYWLELGTHSGRPETVHPPQPHFSVAADAAEDRLYALMMGVRYD